MSDGARMDDILGQALAKAEITQAGPIKIQPRIAPANAGQGNHVAAPLAPPSGHNHHQQQQQAHHPRTEQSVPMQKVVQISRPRNGPTHDIANFKTTTSQGQQLIVVRNGQQGNAL